MNADVLPPLIFLMGPTASGKTDLAIRLGEQFPLDIISVDSAMIYRDMNIGTAKPNAATLRKAPHRLIDIINPGVSYSVARFCNDALIEIRDIIGKGRIPLLVGGTMLYFKALEYGISDLPEADIEIRQDLERRLQEKGLSAMHGELSALDPESAARIHPNDPQRILRALEVCIQSGQSMTSLHALGRGQTLPYKLLKIILCPEERSILHQRIEQRFVQMLELGFIEEVSLLRKKYDLSVDLPSMRAVGYRQVWEYLENMWSYGQMQERGVIATRQLAKRQLTWLRKADNAYWTTGDSESIQALANIIAKHIDQ